MKGPLTLSVKTKMASLHLVELVILATACMLVQGESIPSVVQNNGQHLGKEEDAGDPSLNGLPEDDQAKMKQNNPVQVRSTFTIFTCNIHQS